MTPSAAPNGASPQLLTPADARRLGERLADNVERALRGKRAQVELVLVALAARGHVLVEDVPGVGKSTLAQGVARSLALPFARLQFTSDLLPSDILGVSTWDAGSGAFHFRPGPIFHAVVLADEINRTPPRTQSALLEAMSEGQVSLEGVTRPLPKPFLVVATQNPLEQQGTYPLPESQLDRFLVRVSIGYADRDTERAVLLERGLVEPVTALAPVATGEEIQRLQAAAAAVRLEPVVADYALALTHATREGGLFATGVSMRGALALVGAAKARALLAGRDHVRPGDVKALALPVLAHRLVPAGRDAVEARWEESAELLSGLIERVPVPE